MVNNCLAQANCMNTVGSYVCECPTGYSGDGINDCANVDECAVALANAAIQATATTTTQATTTTAASSTTTGLFGGIFGRRRKRRQASLDPNAAQCDPTAVCVDTAGSYQCICPTGMRESATRVCEGESKIFNFFMEILNVFFFKFHSKFNDLIKFQILTNVPKDLMIVWTVKNVLTSLVVIHASVSTSEFY